MSYQALYRRFRPNSFEGVIGQNHIIRTLKNQVLSGKVSHAYLFCGTRGTGKTSTAKVFANAINCLDLQNGDPCGMCSLCLSAKENRSVNVIEIDAASNNGVDNIREIREEVKYPPTEGKFKVYIIDEVHMLSTGAFNALLKTLEEPPNHVIFILATTDPQKVPATIHSRCQRFDFRRITKGEIAATLKEYLDEMNLEVTADALDYISILADGSMRDSLSILDRSLAFYYNETITYEKILNIVGAVDKTVFFNMFDALINKRADQGMDIIDEMVINGRDITYFIVEFLSHLRNLLVSLTVNEAENILDMSEHDLARLKKQSESVSSHEIIFLIREFSKLLGDVKYASDSRILLEVVVINLCSHNEKTDTTSILAKIAMLERQIKQGVVREVVVSEGNFENSNKIAKKKPKKERPKALPENINEAILRFDEVVERFDDVVTKSLMNSVRPGYMEDNRLSIICHNKGLAEILLKKVDVINNALKDTFNIDFEIKLVTEEEFSYWELNEYGNVSGGESQEDLEFASLMGGYFPEEDNI